MVWLQFIICAGLVVLVGITLSRYADVLAEKTGLGRSWVGAVLLAGATSLPELATGISAVIVVGDVNLAAGGVLGSCLFNLALIAMLDLSSGTTPLLKRAHISQVLAAGLGCILLTSVMASLYVTQTLTVPTLGWIGIPSVIILGIYILSVRMLSFYEKRRVLEVLEQQAEVYQYASISMTRAVVVFGLAAAAMCGLGLWLAAIGEEITVVTGLGASFVGAIFLAMATSLPEMVASLAAMRMGAVDLAVSNIFGSNIFNIAALAIYDIVYLKGNLWAEMAPIHGFTAVASALMTALAIVGLVYQATKKPRWFVSWAGLMLLLLYIGSVYVVYISTG
ncbi:MAG: sodium:calcium antiporter [Herpetosiphonaceae bacterium]|nr:sodium:calcium antiporter [Herpetosiphonaceae bacterium]